ncbi:M48 family metallopeptidase [Aquimonas sp.]|jgi:Zn-dependent protease with chaperone function|uniref:M48 family metallopeptidase n=1 Tax=Aquimonas sp. TaxID=1872588 RepID=UPI0037BFFDF0
MNFFERQAQARVQSHRLLLLFAAAVTGTVLAVSSGIYLMLLFGAKPEELQAVGGPVGLALDRAGLLLVAAVGTLAVIAAASLFRIASLRGGGAAVARSMGGREVSEDTRDPELRRLRNVVEEIAIASSVPVPAIFVLDEEPGINAFAAGYAPGDAAIAVSRGALLHLNRDELQGVIAHEFSHVLNGDMRLNIRLMGLLFGILALGVIGARVLELTRGGRDSKNAAPIIAISVVLMIVGYVGLFFGRLIKAAVSRQREFLADASAVQFTRQTQGIAGALKKIGGLQAGSKLQAGDTEEVAHMLFGDGMGFSSLFATHPPLHARIQALEPGFNPQELDRLRAQWAMKPPHGLEEDIALGFSTPSHEPLPARSSDIPLQVERVVQQVATPSGEDFQRAGSLRAAIPAAINSALQVPERAQALLLALLLDREEQLRGQQLHAVRELLGNEAAQTVPVEAALLIGLHPALRLPVLLLALGPIRHLGRTGQQKLGETVEALIHVDGRLELFEYATGLLLSRQIEDNLHPSARARARLLKLNDCADAAADLLAVLAWYGHDSEATARRAYLSALHAALPQQARPYMTPANWQHRLDQALPKLDRIDPAGKRLLLEAMVVAITHDQRVSLEEGELLRTVCAYLRCPLPPVLE